MGDINPPILLPMFIIPPAVPLFLPAIFIIVAQKGPSTHRINAVANARLIAANTALVVCAPTEIN